jgi:hypothetical protein
MVDSVLAQCLSMDFGMFCGLSVVHNAHSLFN